MHYVLHYDPYEAPLLSITKLSFPLKHNKLLENTFCLQNCQSPHSYLKIYHSFQKTLDVDSERGRAIPTPRPIMIINLEHLDQPARTIEASIRRKHLPSITVTIVAMQEPKPVDLFSSRLDLSNVSSNYDKRKYLRSPCKN